MDLAEIGAKLVAYCNEGRDADALEELYAEDAMSIEAVGHGGNSPVTAGRAGIRAKHAWWNDTFETHSSKATGPFTHGDDRFAVIFEADFTDRATGARDQMREVAVYHIRDGKIVREEFFYAAG